MDNILIIKLMAAVVIFIAAMVLFLRPVRNREQQSLLVAVLFWGLAAGILIYSLFPETEASGKWTSFKLGGPIAVALVVWVFFNKKLKAAVERDELNKMKQQLNIKKSPVVEYSEKIPYKLKSNDKLTVGIAAGDIIDFMDMDVWVNSENQHMMMARFMDTSISGIIRNQGAKKHANGKIIEDTIAEALQQATGGETPVELGSLYETGPGELGSGKDGRKVRKILHIATVIGLEGQGYFTVDNHKVYVRKILHHIARHNTQAQSGEETLRSVLLPLFGTGTAKHDARQIIHTMLNEAVRFLQKNPDTGLAEIWLLVYKKQEKDWLKAAMDGHEGLQKA